MESSVEFLEKLKIQLPYDPVIPFLDICPLECKKGYDRTTCTSMFITALFTIVSLWKQSRYPKLMNGLRKCGTYTQWSIILP
jgi:hypothetical protein